MPKAIINGATVEVSEEEVTLTRQQTFTANGQRRKRDELLAETDWWASSDRTITQAQIDYRQALRDITSQAGFPNNVTWPTKPELGG